MAAAGLDLPALQAVLRREDAARRSPATQQAYAAAEASGTSDWMAVTRTLQETLLREAGVPPERMAAALHLLRGAAHIVGADALGDALPLYVRHNRATAGRLREGDRIPSALRLHQLDGTPLALGEAVGRGVPTLLVAGSWT